MADLSATDTPPDHPAYRLLHADALRLLRALEPADRQQELVRLDLLAHLQAHPDAMAKAGPPVHVTASCFVLDPTLERVLLTHHRKAGLWFQFGGHLEPQDRSIRAAAEREALEESGLDRLRVTPFPIHLDRHLLVGSFDWCEEHLDIRYAATASPGSRHRASAESYDVRWWPVDRLPEGTREELRVPLASARAALSAQPGPASGGDPSNG